jgi:hypothetical protein
LSKNQLLGWNLGFHPGLRFLLLCVSPPQFSSSMVA